MSVAPLELFEFAEMRFPDRLGPCPVEADPVQELPLQSGESVATATLIAYRKRKLRVFKPTRRQVAMAMCVSEGAKLGITVAPGRLERRPINAQFFK